MEAPLTPEHWDQGSVYRVDRARLPASDADRERVMDTLSVAYVQGRLAKEEFLTRASQALAAQTHGELAAIRLTAPSRRGRRRRRPARARKQSLIDAKSIAWAMFMLLMPATVVLGLVTHYVVFYFMFLVAFIGVAVTAQPDA